MGYDCADIKHGGHHDEAKRKIRSREDEKPAILNINEWRIELQAMSQALQHVLQERLG